MTDKMLAGKGDQAKGRIKQAAGKVTGDEDMVDEGRAQYAKGAVHEIGHDVAHKVKAISSDTKDR